MTDLETTARALVAEGKGILAADESDLDARHARSVPVYASRNGPFSVTSRSAA